jgi:lysozyme
MAPSSVRGVDVSYYQGQIDWGAVHAAGVGFAIARVSDGLSHLDPEFADNWRGIRETGLLRGAYQYFEPSDDVRAQADLVVEKVGRLESGDLPVALDVEATSGLAPAALGDEIEAWLEHVAAGTGKPPLIYTLSGFWDGSVASDRFGDSPLWIASYGAACPTLPAGWSAFRFWQRGTGSEPGVATTVDLDVFDGGLPALLAFAGPTEKPDPADAGTIAEPGAAPFDGGVATSGDAAALAAGDSGMRRRPPRWDIALGSRNAPPSSDGAGAVNPVTSGDDAAQGDAAPRDEGTVVDAPHDAAPREEGTVVDAPRTQPSAAAERRASGCSVGKRAEASHWGWSVVIGVGILRRRKSPRRRSPSPRAPQNPKKRSGMRSAC